MYACLKRKAGLDTLNVWPVVCTWFDPDKLSSSHYNWQVCQTHRCVRVTDSHLFFYCLLNNVYIRSLFKSCASVDGNQRELQTIWQHSHCRTERVKRKTPKYISYGYVKKGTGCPTCNFVNKSWPKYSPWKISIIHARSHTLRKLAQPSSVQCCACLLLRIHPACLWKSLWVRGWGWGSGEMKGIAHVPYFFESFPESFSIRRAVTFAWAILVVSLLIVEKQLTRQYT